MNDNNRDGFMQQAVHEGVAPYTPSSMGGGCPFAAPGAGTYTHVPRAVEGPKVKLRPASFDDHFSQATLFYRSLAPVEQEHVAGAFSFELAKCVSPEIRERMVRNLGEVDADLAEQVAAHLGLDAPAGSPIDPAALSPALSMVDTGPGPLDGRKVAVLVGDTTSTRLVNAWRKAADPLGVEIVVVGPNLATLPSGVPVDQSIHITDPVEYDGVVLAAEPDEAMGAFVQEAFRHHKTIGLSGNGSGKGSGAHLGIDSPDPGVTGDPSAFFDALALHRHWDR